MPQDIFFHQNIPSGNSFPQSFYFCASNVFLSSSVSLLLTIFFFPPDFYPITYWNPIPPPPAFYYAGNLLNILVSLRILSVSAPQPLTFTEPFL